MRAVAQRARSWTQRWRRRGWRRSGRDAMFAWFPLLRAAMETTPKVRSSPFAGRYSIEREIGRGATATVYLAHDAESGASVAIKVLRDELGLWTTADRFLREVNYTA